MSKYTGIPCERCGHAFEKDDDIVVCPECGAPHHRSCYRELSRCALADRHAPDFEWISPAAPQSSYGRQGQGDTIICPQCSTVNPRGNTSCQLCGTPLSHAASAESYRRDEYGRPAEHDESEHERYDNPFSSSHEAWEIDGVSSREFAAYTGNSAFYFLRQFPRLVKARWNMSWNWPAFFFNYFYFFFRRLYLPGFLLLIFFTALDIPALLYSIELLKADYIPQVFGVTVDYSTELMEQMYAIIPYLNIVRVAASAFCGFFANRMFLKKAVSDIKRIRSDYTPDNTRDYYTALYFRGRPSIMMVLAVLGLFFMAYSYIGSSVLSQSGLLSLL